MEINWIVAVFDSEYRPPVPPTVYSVLFTLERVLMDQVPHTPYIPDAKTTRSAIDPIAHTPRSIPTSHTRA